jgi:hypothetical protein
VGMLFEMILKMIKNQSLLNMNLDHHKVKKLHCFDL